MANLFDPAQSPTVEPTEIVVGDFIQWRRTDIGSDYPNTAYTMTYVARICIRRGLSVHGFVSDVD